MITVTVSIESEIAHHFLLRTPGLTCTLLNAGGSHPLAIQRSGPRFTVTIPSSEAGALDLRFEVRYQLGGKGWVLHKIRQVLVIPPSTKPALMPVRWYKGASVISEGIPVNTPPLHPDLRVSGLAVTVAPAFLDITDLFMSIHGQTPWFRTLELVRTTDFSLRVLAYLGGRPLIWYVAIPVSAREATTLTPHLSYFPADFGGITYPHDREEGITTRNHNTTVTNLQSGGNVLCSYLLSPLKDAEYIEKAGPYTAAQKRFEDFRTSDQDTLPPELHHMRAVLGYQANATDIWLKHWSMPFGFERTIAGTSRVLVFPQLHGGDAGRAIHSGLRQRLAAALNTIATQGQTLRMPTVTVGSLILSGYSQAGGNLFTASDNNLSDLKAIVCVETQYVNEFLKGENTSHVLGRVVIPKLIRARVRVVVISRTNEAWQRAKYLPRDVPAASLTVLPPQGRIGATSYPPDVSHPFQGHRLGRLLRPQQDAVLQYINGPGAGVLPPRVSGMELLVDNRIADMRAAGMDDRKLITTIFSPGQNNDQGGGMYGHNFAMSGGEDPAPFEPSGTLKPGQRPKTFVQQALELIG